MLDILLFLLLKISFTLGAYKGSCLHFHYIKYSLKSQICMQESQPINKVTNNQYPFCLFPPSSVMKISPYFQVDCTKITVLKEHQQIIIRAKATICFSTEKPSTSGLIFLNADTLKNISEQYSQLFNSQVVSSPISQQVEVVPKAQQNPKPLQKDVQNPASNSSQSPFRSNNAHQYSFERKEENSSSAQPNFRKNLNVFSTSNQPSNYQLNSNNQNNSNNQPSNYNFQSNQNPPNPGSNIFFAPSSQQRPTIFDTTSSVRSSSNSDSRNRTNKNAKTRIQ